MTITGADSTAVTAASKKAESAKSAEAAATRLLEKSELALVAAQEKALLATTQLGAARARLSGAISSLTAAEQALAAAERSKNAELIEAAQANLAVAQAEEVRARGVARTIVLANAEAAALAKVAAEEAKAAKSTQGRAAAMQAGASATANATTSTTALTRAQELNAASAARLAGVQEAMSLTTTALAASRARLREVNAAAALSEKALEAAIATGNAAIVASQAAITRRVLLLRELAVADTQAAIAEVELAAASRATSQTIGQVQTAGVAAGAGMLGLRGAVLTAGTAFLGATIAFQSGAKAIQAATDRTEELNKSTEVFGESAQQIKDFAETTATSLGISNVEALRATGIFGNLFRSINIGTPAAAEMSEALVRLAADLASFNNADPSQVLDNLRSGLVGEPEPLRKFGIFLSQARAQQEALNATGKESVKQLTQQEIVQARFNIILRDSVLAQGDFARTSENLANQTRILKAQVGDLGADLGSVLIPALTLAVGAANDYVTAVSLAVDATKDFASSIPLVGDALPGTSSRVRELGSRFLELGGRLALFPGVALPVTAVMLAIGDRATGAKDAINDMAHSFPGAGRAAQELANDLSGLKDVLTELSGLEVEQLEIQTGITPGGRDAEMANLREQIEADKRAVAAAASGSAARRKALEELARDQAALAALEREAAAEAQAAADDKKAAAEKAASARREADQALLATLGNRREDAERKAAAAAQTTTLTDDIKAQDRIQALIKIQIAKVKAQVKDEKLRAAALRELRIAQIESQRAEDELRRQRAEAQAAQRQEGITLDIEFAETTGNVAREVAARRRLIALLKKQQAAVKKGTVEWKRLRNEIAEQQQAIKDAEGQAKEADDQGNRAAEFFFEQLQAQQGFAANLLGNLIPRDQTGGLVGLPSPAGPVIPNLGAAAGAAAGAAQGRAMTAPTSGQVSTTNDILLRILAQLKGLNSSASAPEAVYQKNMGKAAMTGGGGNVEVM